MRLLQFFLTTALIIGLGLGLNSQSYQLTESDFSITGTSNLHDWESEVTKMTWSGTFQFSEGGLESIKNVRVSIPVEGIISSKGRIMDKKTYGALQSDKHPNISYSLANCAVSRRGDRFVAQTKGRLTVAGTTRTAPIEILINELSNGQLVVTGDYSLKMTDYGIEPPTALLGTLTTGDEVGLHFKLTLSPQ